MLTQLTLLFRPAIYRSCPLASRLSEPWQRRLTSMDTPQQEAVGFVQMIHRTFVELWLAGLNGQIKEWPSPSSKPWKKPPTSDCAAFFAFTLIVHLKKCSFSLGGWCRELNLSIIKTLLKQRVYSRMLSNISEYCSDLFKNVFVKAGC